MEHHDSDGSAGAPTTAAAGAADDNPDAMDEAEPMVVDEAEVKGPFFGPQTQPDSDLDNVHLMRVRNRPRLDAELRRAYERIAPFAAYIGIYR